MNRNTARKITQFARTLCLVLACALVAQAQVTTGNVRGTVTDPQGAVVPNAKVTITKKSNNDTKTDQTSDQGEFQFNNLLVGEDYTVTIEAPNFKTLTLTQVRVSLNQNTDLPAQLTVGGLGGETVEVVAGGGELVDTTTNNLSKSFSERQVVELAQTSIGAGVNNLSLLAPGVSSSGGVGVGTGGSVGGQRPRNNNFVIDGVDNNDKSVTGPQSYISPEEVAEFSLLQNQFSAEFARSNGGQFITVTKSGTNEFHGELYGFFRNRFLNAIDNIQKPDTVRERNVAGRTFLPRSDYDRFGFNVGGPVILPKFGEGGPSLLKMRDKLFFFTSYERIQTGAASPPGGIAAPTAAGLATLRGLSGVSARNFGVLTQYLPVAATGNLGTIDACLVVRISGECTDPTPATPLVNENIIPIPVGSIQFPSPNFSKQNHAVINIDYTQSAATQYRFRFTFTNTASIDTAANLPVFFIALPGKQRLFSATVLHNFTSNLINETRLAFRRSSQAFPVPNITFPGLTVFPNLTFDDLGVNIGPDPNAPQTNIENNYQVVDTLTYLAGNHSFKFGGDFRDIISPQTFSQRVRGDYEYLALDTFLRDRSPDSFGQRNAGNNVYYGNQKILYAFAQDDWRIRPNLTLNMGIKYSYQDVPLGARTSQALNAISSVPGLIEFRSPKSQKKNFAPTVGFAYSPNYEGGMLGRIFGSNGKSSLRAGFSMGYDYIFDNLYILSNPPQLQQTNDVDTDAGTPNFLANGGLPDSPVAITSAAVARANTGAFIPDQKVPYSLTYTGSFQRQFMKDWSFELRYLGTRGVHLLTQNRLNRQARVAPEEGRFGLPTYINNAPTQAQIDTMTGALNLATINARSNAVPRYAAAGFGGAANIVAFLSNGNSTYNGGSAQLTRRFAQGLQMTAAYTFSHLIDDTTAEVFSTVLSPRRVEDFQNLRRERADSALDHRHRFVSSGIYELPFFNKSENHLLKTALGGFSIAATYTYESGEKITIRSGTDANLNGDNAGDRAIFNPAGQEGVGSLVRALVRTCTSFNPDGSCTQSVASRTVGYAAVNANARYIQAASGAMSNIGRNTFSTPAINNVDLSLFKNFAIGESRRIQFRADFFNAFNHPQYVPGSVNSVSPVSTVGLTTLNQVAPLTPDFLRPDRVLSSNPRVVQLAAKFIF